MNETSQEDVVGAAPGTGGFFLPSVAVARSVDKKVRDRLNTSFPWLAENYACLDIDPAVLAKWQASPTDFGLYFDLASAVHHSPESVNSEENLARAQRLADSVKRTSADVKPAERLTIRTLEPGHYDAVEVDCLLRWFDLEPENSMALLPLDDGEFDVACAVLQRALSFLEEAVPVFYGELTALTSELVFAKPGPDAKLSFGGASSFALWGAMALNAKAHADWWEYLPRLIHEYSHNLLFGLAADSQLVTNDTSERYRSPLRDALRPIDGIYHACYVSAREAVAMEEILAALPRMDLGKQSKTVENYCRSIRQNSTEAHQDCRAVLDEHARLSDLGKRVLDDTAAAMLPR